MKSYKLIAVVLLAWLGVPKNVMGETGALRDGRVMSLDAVDSEPAKGNEGTGEVGIAKVAKAVEASPKDRKLRFKLVKALMDTGEFERALDAAREWRQVDAYNLVVVRLMGDILVELGQLEQAKRVYSAVVELLPKDAGAHRALATVLKQSKDVTGAYRLLKVAVRLRPEDKRLLFELADAAYRCGHLQEAEDLFGQLAADPEVAKAVAYPAKQRLAQILSVKRVASLKAGKEDESKALEKEIAALKVKGGAINDIKIYLSWDTDGSDVDLWVVNPAGQKVNYEHKKGKFGGALYSDVTTGYGPESFTATVAAPGEYVVKVNYFSTNRARFSEARGEVVVVLAEGTKAQQRHVFPYKLFNPKQTVTVAKIKVSKEK